jgi:hypothetical protein
MLHVNTSRVCQQFRNTYESALPFAFKVRLTNVAVRENQASVIEFDTLLKKAWTYSSVKFQKRPNGIYATANTFGYQLKYKILTDGVAKVIVQLGHLNVTKGHFYFGIREDGKIWVDDKDFYVGEHSYATVDCDVKGEKQLDFFIHASGPGPHQFTLSKFRIV